METYRHFKGEYYYVTHLAKCHDNYNNRTVIYFNICHPIMGVFSRPEWDFVADNDTYDVDDKIPAGVSALAEYIVPIT